MKKHKKRREYKLYTHIRKYLEKQGYFCGKGIQWGSKEGFYVDLGGHKYLGLRADVAGIKNIGNDLIDKIEIVVVEVRNKPTVSNRDIVDAAGYAVIAHKCYLATTAEIKENNIRDAQAYGVGLLQISKDGRNYKVEEISDAEQKIPDEAKMLKFLKDSLMIVQCTLCKCFIFSWSKVDDKKFYTYKELQRCKSFGLFSRNCNSLPPYAKEEKINKKIEVSKEFKIARFLCRECFGLLFPDKRNSSKLK